ncbi:MAG: DUF1592 domain-containing protein, partial [Bryobacteraceae bacterium]
MKFCLPLSLFLATSCFAASRVGSAPDDAGFRNVVQPFLAKNCAVCHSAKLKTGGLDVQSFHSAADLQVHRELWENIVRKLSTGEMPPKGLPRPPQTDVKAVTKWVQAEFSRLDKQAPVDPGRVTARRLNRYEYNATIRDLVGVDFHPADDFPADNSGYGFDNIGDVLSLSPVLMERYLAAAEKIAKAAIVADPLPKPTIDKIKCGSADIPCAFEVAAKRNFPFEGDYDVRVNFSLHQPVKDLLSSETMPFALLIDGAPVKVFEAVTGSGHKRSFEQRVHLSAGTHDIRAALESDDFVAPDSNAFADTIEMRGPFNPVAPPLPESHKRIFICNHPNGHHTPECARLIMENFARRAWRRPVTPAEVDRLVGFVNLAQQHGDNFEQGIRVAVEAVLVSPDFLFRIERDPRPLDPKDTHRVSDFDLATRLSYFLWSSMPDEDLYRTAAAGTLHDPAVLEAEVQRMLKDPKAKALVENFAGQWLEIRNLDSIKPDPDKFPQYTPALRDAMKKETQLFFESIVQQDRSIMDFIDANYTFLNEPLAKFYDIPGVTGDNFRRVELTDHRRGGVITMASVLTVSSYPTRTSPVIRGKYVLENILNAPPPPPPPDVPNLDASGVGITGTMRQQLEKHRSNPVCASCHSRMDPLGFGLSNFDAIGRWRTHDGKFPIDASGTLPNGEKFNGPAELKKILMGDKDAFSHCLAEKMLTYALGRGLESYDTPAISL